MAKDAARQLLEQLLEGLNLNDVTRPSSDAVWLEFLTKIEAAVAELYGGQMSAGQKLAAQFETLFQVSPNPMLIFVDNEYVDCNHAAIKILGASHKLEILAHHPVHFSPDLQVDGQTSKVKAHEMIRLARQNGSHQFEWIHRKLDGTEFPVDVTLAPVTWEGKSGLLVLWVDLSEKRKRDLQNIQNAKMVSLGELSAGIAHEINNPLAVISLSLSLVERFKDDPEKFANKLSAIRKSCDRISKIVSGLKKFSRSDKEVKMAAKPLCEIVQEALLLTESKAKGQQVEVKYESKSFESIYCDEIQIEQVIVNLITNAIDAVKDKEEKWVQVSLSEADNFIFLRVKDSGKGISEDIRNMLFQPFFTTKAVGEGTGLGLSITKGILDDHQAVISILAQDPNTCFEIRFKKYASGIKAS